ncbi:MAG: sterol desaturase family protein, partial [Ferrovibrionaceae bacterium]
MAEPWPLPDPVALAIPAFIQLLLLEIAVARWRGRDAYELRDTAASLTMGLGNLALKILRGGVAVAATVAVHQH